MLKKLFVHEWKDTWKLVTLFNVIVIVFTIIGAVGVANENWIKAVEKNGWYGVVFISYFMLYYFAILALGLATSFYFLMRFYKNYYTDQGYLMHTLPVSSNQLILSKALVMYIWQTISGFVIFISIMVLVNGLFVGMGEEATFFEILQEAFGELFMEMKWTFADVVICIILVLALIGSQIFSIVFGYLAISLGQLSKNHKLLASIGIYVGMQTVLQFVMNMFQMAISIGVADVDVVDIERGIVIAVLLLFTILIFAANAAMYAGSNYIMKNKLNLE